ncbi:hypothetical protein M3Y98_00920200 [Aphelenchoides besseyi]|nr:hypothetical protein M3Y98_00920200 [Aphelenchoides besseyi]KAI6193443.1 hypothetical protein M3Y96_01018200 [Aphelenchoides besseyi]
MSVRGVSSDERKTTGSRTAPSTSKGDSRQPKVKSKESIGQKQRSRTSTANTKSNSAASGSKRARPLSSKPKRESRISERPLTPDDKKFDALKLEDQLYREAEQKTKNKLIDVEVRAKSPRKPESRQIGPTVTAAVTMNTTTDQKQSVVVAAEPVAIPGENLQQIVDHGEHLIQFPTLSIVFNFAELVLTIIGLVLALVATGAHIGVSYMIIVNGILILLLLAALTFIQWSGLHISKEMNLNEHPSFGIKPKARRYLAAIHLLRLALLGSSISIFVYFGACGDGHKHQPSVCKYEAVSSVFLYIASVLFLIQLLLAFAHLVFYCKNRMSIRGFH